jgi:hypothetical protein
MKRMILNRRSIWQVGQNNFARIVSCRFFPLRQGGWMGLQRFMVKGKYEIKNIIYKQILFF